MIFITSRNVFYLNGMLLQLLETLMRFKNSYELNTCPYLRVIRSFLRCILFYSMQSSVENNGKGPRWLC